MKRWGWALLAFAVAAPARAQRLGASGVAFGAEAVSYRFGDPLAVKSLSQWAVPVAVVFSRGRTLLDAGVYYASTRLALRNGTTITVTGFTDTQVRAAYVLGDDRAVFTAVVNLPTGASDLTASEYTVLAVASSSFYRFPVNAYGSGASLTAGAAWALPAGSWNFGLAGSLRVADDFTPFRDDDGPFTYQAGLESRLRLGADRLIGDGRLSMGLTMSTFSDDEFATGAGAVGAYRPGDRFILEGSYETVIGTVSLLGYAWDYLRISGDSSGVDSRNRENILAGGVRAAVPLSRTVTWESGLEGRASWPEEGNSILAELTTGLRMRLSRRLSAIPQLRLDAGRLQDPGTGFHYEIRGLGLSVLLRGSL